MENSEKRKRGTKFDNGKLKWILLPWDVMTDVVRVFMFGAHKYGERNWELGMDKDRLMDAALRHITKYICGEGEDGETGIDHLAHAIVSLLMIMSYRRRIAGDIEKQDTKMSYGWCQDYLHGGLYKVKPLTEKGK